MKKALTGSLLTILLACSISQALADEEAPRITIEVPQKAVRGFPIPVYFTVQGPLEFVETDMLKDLSSFQMELTKGEYGVTFYPAYIWKTHNIGYYYPPSASGLSSGPHEEFGPLLGLPADTVSLGSTERASFCLDLSRLVVTWIGPDGKKSRPRDGFTHLMMAASPDWDLPHGTYTFALIYGGKSAGWNQRQGPKARVQYLNGQQLALQPPNNAEQKLLDRLYALNGVDIKNPTLGPTTNSPWESLVMHYDDLLKDPEIDLTAISPTARDQLAYHLSLVELVHGKPGRLQNTIANPGPISKVMLPQLLLLQYDALVAEGRAKEAEACRQRLWDEFPHFIAHDWGFRKGKPVKNQRSREVSLLRLGQRIVNGKGKKIRDVAREQQKAEAERARKRAEALKKKAQTEGQE